MAASRERDPTTRLKTRLARDGYLVLREVVPRDSIDDALRCVHLDVLHRGLAARQIAEWQESKCWFPHLRWDPAILQLLEHVPAELREGLPCEPQILLHLPDEAEEWPLVPHVDEPPPWADRRPYTSIVGVALSPGTETTGGLVVWPFDGSPPRPVDVGAGDVVVMHPQLEHSGTLNRSGEIRYVVYFRFVADD